MDANLLKEIEAMSNEPKPRPDNFGVTIAEVMDAKKAGRTVIERQLRELVEAGLLEARFMTVKVNGVPRKTWVYAKPDDWIGIG